MGVSRRWLYFFLMVQFVLSPVARMGQKSGMDTWSHRYAGSTNVGVCVLNTKQGAGAEME